MCSVESGISAGKVCNAGCPDKRNLPAVRDIRRNCFENRFRFCSIRLPKCKHFIFRQKPTICVNNEKQIDELNERILIEVLSSVTGVDYTPNKITSSVWGDGASFSQTPEVRLNYYKGNLEKSPDWKLEHKLDASTGIVTVLIVPTSDKIVTVDVLANFPCRGRKGYEFFKGFDIGMNGRNAVKDSDMKKLIKKLNHGNGWNSISMPHAFEFTGHRDVVIEKDETFSKEMFIWDVQYWDELCEIMQSNKMLEFDLYKVVFVKVDEQDSIQDITIPINYEFISKMRQVKSEYEDKIAEKNSTTK
jgi:hypothetical protein